MGVIKQGILGGFSGKVGGVVGSSWKGIAVMKAKPLSVANPRTAAQIEQREKMSGVVFFATSILASVIKPLWDRFAQQMSGYNAFVQRNISNFANDFPTVASNLIISTGKMASTPILTALGVNVTGLLTVTWANDSGEGLKLATDEAYIVYFSSDDEVYKGFATGVQRHLGTATVDVDNTPNDFFTGHAYLAFRRSDGTVVSDTSYKVTGV